MLKHGGRLENYFSRRCVTHIICSNLPDCKIKNLRFILVFFFKLITLDFFFLLEKFILIVIVCNSNSDPLVEGSQW
jgi:hypothetical protein